jgi:hypothetical protein
MHHVPVAMSVESERAEARDPKEPTRPPTELENQLFKSEKKGQVKVLASSADGAKNQKRGHGSEKSTEDVAMKLALRKAATCH